MKIAIFDPFNHIPGLTLLFPEADYYVYEPDSEIHFKATKHMSNNVFFSMYGYYYKTNWKCISEEEYSTFFIVLPFLDCFPGNWCTKSEAVTIWSKITEIIAKRNFEKICLFDTYDYDYDPSILFPEISINFFFKRNMNKHKVYSSNVYPFPFTTFITPCALTMYLTKTYKHLPIEGRNESVFWSGGIYDHDEIHSIHGVNYRVNRRRTQIFNEIQHTLSVKHGLSHTSFMDELSTYKFAVDLEGVGDPNNRTFEILLTNTLRLHNNNDVVWPFNETFSQYTIFKTSEEYLEKLYILQTNKEIYNIAINTQRYIFEKYFNKIWLRSYILESSGLVTLSPIVSNNRMYCHKWPGNGIRPSFGNNLFCYFASKILEKELNVSVVDNKECLNNPILVDDDKWQVFDINSFQNKDIYMEGYYQNSKNLLLYRDFIKSLIHKDNKECIMPFTEPQFITISDIAMYKADEPDKNDIVIHLRLGDFKHAGNSEILHPNVYFNILDSIEHSSIVIVVDKIKEDFEIKYIESFKRKYPNIRIRSSSILGDFIYLSKANRIIVSNSTFCWLATFIGNATEIYIIKNIYHPNQVLENITETSKIYIAEYISVEDIIRL